MAMAMARDAKQLRLGRPPLPGEHGAWVMLYTPLLAAAIGAGADVMHAVLLTLSVTGAFFGQHAAGLMLRGRGGAQARRWLGIYAGVFALCGAMVLWVSEAVDLLWIGIPAFGLMAWQLGRSRFSRKRVDRSAPGEFLAIGGLTLTAPGAVVVATGALSLAAVGIWGLFALFFGSSVFFVKMHLLAAQVKQGVRWEDRLRLGRGLLVYHGALVAGLLAVYLMGTPAGGLLILGFAPVMLRALAGWARLSNRLPNLKRVGLIESAYALWFSGFIVAILRMGLM